MHRKKKIPSELLVCILAAFLSILYLMFGPDLHSRSNESALALEAEVYPSQAEPLLAEVKLELYRVDAEEEGKLIYAYNGGTGYRYGPSILRNEDGSFDIWLSAPGNGSSQWDWITYRHSEDGENWSKEKVVLKPTPGSKDRCSVCDPGVICFDGWYYLAYTSTADANGKGNNNSAFVARSENPDGPYEKWNGSGWGGDPEPILAYEGDARGWGIGEVSFVIRDEDLFIYYTYFDLNGGYTALAKADLTDDWPATIREKGKVCDRKMQDSLDVVYCEDLNTFLAFSIDCRMSESSRVIMYESEDGRDFEQVDVTKTNIEDYAHNMGISKDACGHIRSDEKQLIGYAYGRSWGRWSARLQKIEIRHFYQIKKKKTL